MAELPATKAALLALIDVTRAELDAAVAAVPPEDREKSLPSGLSVKDILAHVTFWENYLVERIEATAAGNLFDPFPYETDATVDQINARVFAQYHSQSWDVIAYEYDAAHRRALALLATLDDDDLFDPARSAAVIGDERHTVLEHVYAETAEHFAEHAAEINGWRQGSGAPAPGGADACPIVRPLESYAGLQGLNYFGGISAQNVGAQALCMHLLKMPPGARAKAHLHENHETAIYLITGKAAMWYGPNLEHHLEMNAGEFLYIPAGVPHLPYNPGETEAVAVLSRTDPNEQESVRLRPDLDALRGAGA